MTVHIDKIMQNTALQMNRGTACQRTHQDKLKKTHISKGYKLLGFRRGAVTCGGVNCATKTPDFLLDTFLQPRVSHYKGEDTKFLENKTDFSKKIEMLANVLLKLH